MRGWIARKFSRRITFCTAARPLSSPQFVSNRSGGSIVGNQAINNGGIINDATKSAAAGNASVLNMTGATAITFADNKARNYGGGIAVVTNGGSTTPAATANLNNMTLNNNRANSDGSGDGGALYQGLAVSGGGTTFTGTLNIAFQCRKLRGQWRHPQ